MHSTLLLSVATARHTHGRQTLASLLGGRPRPTVCDGNGNGDGDCDWLSAFFDCKLFFICGPGTKTETKTETETRDCWLKNHARGKETKREGAEARGLGRAEVVARLPG